MAKRNITAELQAYFKGNIDNRIQTLKDEITALKALKVKMFGKSPTEAKSKPKRKLSAAHKKALMEGKARALAAKRGKE